VIFEIEPKGALLRPNAEGDARFGASRWHWRRCGALSFWRCAITARVRVRIWRGWVSAGTARVAVRNLERCPGLGMRLRLSRRLILNRVELKVGDEFHCFLNLQHVAYRRRGLVSF